jgi:hypothetical protein
MATRPHRPCLRCGNIRKVSHRTLCRPCSVTAAQKGTLNDYPPIDMPQRTLQDFAEDFALLEASGLDYLTICKTMGYSTANRGAALRVLITRAQRAQLLPKRTPLCGWAPRKTLV